MAPADPLLEALAATDAPRLLLAVSGGADSMALLAAAAEACPERIAAVATFDHGTGPHARRAAFLVRRRAEALQVPIVVGRGLALRWTEADWRAARWDFLRREASRLDAVVATAHTRDDQLETIVMRLLRGSGARGLAAMYAPSPVARPFLHLPRAAVRAWGATRGLTFVEDPGNASPAHLRSRVRADLLPAMLAARPALGHELLALSTAAAAVRAELDAVAAGLGEARRQGEVAVALAALAGLDQFALEALWPALAARAGATLDRRGTTRLAEFTTASRTGGTIQLAGGFEVVRDRTELLVRRVRLEPARHAYRVRRLEPGEAFEPADPWQAELPAGAVLEMRPWRPGDRMRAPGARAARRVKRYFADARIPGTLRAGWPIVMAGSEIVWIPGVRRGEAATVRSGRPGVRYVCERIRS